SLGLLEWARGRHREAEAAFRKALAVFQKLAADFPDKSGYRGSQVDLHCQLGGVLAGAGRLDEARGAFGKALEVFPGSAAAHNTLAWLLATCPDVGVRDPGRAVELAQQAIALAPKTGEFWNTLGVAHYRAGHWQQARAALEKSVALRRGGDSFD